MKNTEKLKRWGIIQLVIGIVLIFLSIVVFPDKSFGGMPNVALLIPGVFITFIAFPILLIGFSPEITKFTSKVSSEIIEHAEPEIKDVVSKKANVVIPTVTPVIKTAVNEIRKSKEDELNEAKKLLEDKLITEDEYQQMRKNILNIK